MYLDFFELGYLSLHQCKTIKNMMSTEYHNYKVNWVNNAGNYILSVTTDYEFDNEDEGKDTFISRLVSEGAEYYEKADFLHRLCMAHCRYPYSLVGKQGVHEADKNGDYFFFYQDAEKAHELCPSARMSILEDGTNLAYVPMMAFEEELYPNALKRGIELIIIKP